MFRLITLCYLYHKPDKPINNRLIFYYLFICIEVDLNDTC